MNVQVRWMEMEGERFAVIPECEFRELCEAAGVVNPEADLPAMPPADENGRFPAIESARTLIARDMIKSRRKAGLTQAQLADFAGVRQETVSRIESAKHSVTPRIFDKISAALDQAVAKAEASEKKASAATIKRRSKSSRD